MVDTRSGLSGQRLRWKAIAIGLGIHPVLEPEKKNGA